MNTRPTAEAHAQTAEAPHLAETTEAHAPGPMCGDLLVIEAAAPAETAEAHPSDYRDADLDPRRDQ